MRERALIIAKQVDARALGLGRWVRGASDNEEESDAVEGESWINLHVGEGGDVPGLLMPGLSMPDSSRSDSPGTGDGQRWKGRMWVQWCKASFPALPRRPLWSMGMGLVLAQVSLVPGHVRWLTVVTWHQTKSSDSQLAWSGMVGW